MNIGEERRGEVVILRPEGRIDGTTSPEVEGLVRGRLDAGVLKLVFDLSGVEYVSSAGLRVLFLAVKTLRPRGGQVALAGVNPNVREVLELSGFLSIFPIEPDVVGAVARVGGGS